MNAMQSDQIFVRRMQKSDVKEVFRLGADISEFQVTPDIGFWTQEQLLSWLTKEDDPLLVAETDGEIIGFILCQVHRQTGKATVENIFVKDKYRRHHVGSALLHDCLTKLETIGVTFVCALTSIDNSPVASFWKQHGFQHGHEFTWFERSVKQS